MWRRGAAEMARRFGAARLSRNHGMAGMNLAGKIALGVLGGAAVTLLVALGLVASQSPIADLRAEAGAGLDFTVLSAATPVPLHSYRARDGAALGYRRWDSAAAGAPLVVAVHGSGWHGAQWQGLGEALAGAGLADVVAPDLRGHGPNPQRRGDIDHIGQFEEDLADLISAQARPGQRVVLLGHSSGGGLVVRMAGGAHGGLLNGAVLLAPFLQYDAPTARPDSGGWARVLTRRIIGLTMLNAAGIHLLDHLAVIQFRFPERVLAGPQGATATRAYSWRLNQSFAPRRNWQADVAALPDFLLIAGRQDEAFRAEAYAPVLAALTPRGEYALIEAGHLDVVDHPATLARLGQWLAARP